MPRPKTGSVYEQPKGSGNWRYALTLRDGTRWDRPVPPPADGGPFDEAYARSVKDALLRAYDLRQWDPQATAQPSENTPERTLGDYALAWISRETYEDAEHDKRRLVRHLIPAPIAGMLLKDIRARHCLEYVRWLKARPSEEGGTLAPRTVRTIANLVQRALAQAKRDELIPVSPWDLPRGAVPGREDKHLGERETWRYSPEEVSLLCTSPLLALDRRTIYATLFLSGQRLGEIAALRVGDYDRTKKPLGGLTITKSLSARKKKVKSTKTGVTRYVPVHPRLAAHLAAWLLEGLPALLGRPVQEDDLLFPSTRTGQERTQTGLWDGMQDDLRRLGLRERRIYSTRHTHISMLVDAGARREVFSLWTHGKGKDVITGYTLAKWETLCREMLLLSLPTLQAEVDVQVQAAGDFARGIASEQGGEEEQPSGTTEEVRVRGGGLEPSPSRPKPSHSAPILGLEEEGEASEEPPSTPQDPHNARPLAKPPSPRPRVVDLDDFALEELIADLEAAVAAEEE